MRPSAYQSIGSGSLLDVCAVIQPLKVLVVDDDLNKRLFMAHAVGTTFQDAVIVQCYSGQAALDYMSTSRIDALVTNHSMHPVDGITLIKRLRQGGAKLPIIMVTGDPNVTHDALGAGADHVIPSHEVKTTGNVLRDLLERRGSP